MKGCIQMYISEGSSAHEMERWDALFLAYPQNLAIWCSPTFPLQSYFWFLFCPWRLFYYWPKGRLMDNFPCFQASRKTLSLDFSPLILGNKHQNQVLAQIAVSFFGPVSLPFWSIEWMFSRSLALSFRNRYNYCTLLLPASPVSLLLLHLYWFKISHLVLKWIYHGQVLEWRALYWSKSQFVGWYVEADF